MPFSAGFFSVALDPLQEKGVCTRFFTASCPCRLSAVEWHFPEAVLEEEIQNMSHLLSSVEVLPALGLQDQTFS